MKNKQTAQEVVAKPVEVKQVLAERGSEYEKALKTWKVHGEWVNFLYLTHPDCFDFIMQSGYFANWMHMTGKLLRALSTPNNPDHWADIAGYAELIRRDILENQPK